MRRPTAVLPVSVALLAALPGAAHAAVPALQTDRTCYLQTDKTNVTVTGNGFNARTPYVVSLDGTALNDGTQLMDQLGTMQGTFPPPPLADDELQRTFGVGVASGGLTATTRFTVTRLQANFSPSQGDPTRLRVRFSVAGFGLVDHDPVVFVHYISPKGKLKQTVRLGHATGQCGRIARTAKRALFPFDRPALGKWNLQFDTTRSFTLGNRDSKFLFYSVGVCLQPPGARKPSQQSPCPQQVVSPRAKK
jgi:hypothetical protein